jgi:hypothetical protein
MYIKFLIQLYNDINNDELLKTILKHEKKIKLMIIISNAQQNEAQMGIKWPLIHFSFFNFIIPSM